MIDIVFMIESFKSMPLWLQIIICILSLVFIIGTQCQQLKRYWHLPRIKNQIEYLGQNTLR